MKYVLLLVFVVTGSIAFPRPSFATTPPHAAGTTATAFVQIPPFVLQSTPLVLHSVPVVVLQQHVNSHSAHVVQSQHVQQQPVRSNRAHTPQPQRSRGLISRVLGRR